MSRYNVRLQVPHEIEVVAASRQAAIAKVIKNFPQVGAESAFEGIPSNMSAARVLWVDAVEEDEPMAA